MEIWLLIGLPGAGKSHFCNAIKSVCQKSIVVFEFDKLTESFTKMARELIFIQISSDIEANFDKYRNSIPVLNTAQIFLFRLSDTCLSQDCL